MTLKRYRGGVLRNVNCRNVDRPRFGLPSLRISAISPLAKPNRRRDYTTVRFALILSMLLASSFAAADELALLAKHHDAFQTRVEMIKQAESEISMTCYDIDSSAVPMALLQLLRERAQAGIRVRVILDGFMSRLPLETQKYLTCGGVDIKVFHPLFKGRPDWLNRRMHSKLLVVDRQVMVIGSRNLTDRHFGLEETNFVNCDCVISGCPCLHAACYFDSLWESPDACSLTQDKLSLLSLTRPSMHHPRTGAKIDASETLTRLTTKTGALNDHFQSAVPYSMAPEEIQLLHDFDNKKSKRTMAKQVVELIDSAERTVVIESPYPAFSPSFMDAIKRAAGRGVSITIITNSLASTDQVIVYASYQNQKATLLKHGIKLFEFVGPDHLHAKGMVVDDQWALLGSYNFDARSEGLNLELCILTSNTQAIALINQSIGDRQRQTELVDQHYVVDLNGRPGITRRVHMRSSQLVAPLLRPSL